MSQPDVTVDYQPNPDFVGEDSFTYTLEDNDGNISKQATVRVLVTNSASTIDEIAIPTTITEGVETTLSVTVTDAENNKFTYSWLVENQESSR
jgi:hypothetical protein